MRPTPIALSASFVLLCAWASGEASGQGDESIAVCLADDGGSRWEAVAEEREEPAAPLLAEPWFPRVPAKPFRPLGEGRPDPEPIGRRATLIDFWASWCGPCIEELPHLEAIHRRLGPRGLRVVAANVDDPPEVARETAERLGLTAEIVRPGEALQTAIRPRSLPTLVLVDGAGRIRGRWDGYRPGVEIEVEREATALLERPDLSPVATGAVAISGSGGYRVRWMRELVGSVEGVGVDARGGTRRILVSHGRDLTALEADGRATGRVPAPQGTGRLTIGDVTGDGRADVVGWRPGAVRVGVLDLAERVSTSWEAEAPVFGLAVLPSGSAPAGAPLALATTAGLRFHAGDGRVLARSDFPARSVAESPPAGVSFLDGEGRWTRLDSAGVSVGTVPIGRSAGGLLAVGPCTVATLGDWSDPTLARGASGDVVVAVGRGRDLAVLSAGDGSTIWRSSWERGIAQVAVADLDGDGVDEIVVGTGGAVVVLERVREGRTAS